MATNKTANNYDKLRSMAHEGVPLEKIEEKIEKEEQLVEPVNKAAAISDTKKVKADKKTPKTRIPILAEPLLAEAPEKRKDQVQATYQELFFRRMDFTHRKPLYITAATHRRLMRIVHLMDESKATISSYVENIILNHLETFSKEIDIIYRTNTINPTE